MLLAVFIGRRGWKKQHAAAVCHAMEICVSDSARYQFTNSAVVRELIETTFEGVINVPVERINLPKLEEMLTQEVYIAGAQAYFTDDKTLHVTVSQPAPAFKVEAGKQLYYIIDDGSAIPSKEDWNLNIPTIACGKVPDDIEWIGQVRQLSQWLCSEGELDTIEHIQADAGGELTIKRKGHNETFIFGTPDDYQRKFCSITTYLTRIKPLRQTDKDTKDYTQVNVQYKGQIVCK